MNRLMVFACMCACLSGCSSLQGTQEATAAARPGAAGAPLGVTAKPPNLPLTSANATEPAGWKTFSSSKLGVAIGYPGNWTVSEQADGVTFTSPQGQTIQLKLAQSSVSSPGQCTLLTNSHGMNVNACYDAGTQLYSANFSAQPSGSPRQLVISTTGKGALDVYRQMLDSMRPIP